ncbi:MAG: hypothetical protein GXP23_06995 [Gammaproteobacteria bacterium]|nr:hypothetical protein [Gammaproteobacteria bacterium]
MATQYEKTDRIFPGAIHLAILLLW